MRGLEILKSLSAVKPGILASVITVPVAAAAVGGGLYYHSVTVKNAQIAANKAKTEMAVKAKKAKTLQEKEDAAAQALLAKEKGITAAQQQAQQQKQQQEEQAKAAEVTKQEQQAKLDALAKQRQQAKQTTNTQRSSNAVQTVARNGNRVSAPVYHRQQVQHTQPASSNAQSDDSGMAVVTRQSTYVSPEEGKQEADKAAAELNAVHNGH